MISKKQTHNQIHNYLLFHLFLLSKNTVVARLVAQIPQFLYRAYVFQIR